MAHRPISRDEQPDPALRAVRRLSMGAIASLALGVCACGGGQARAPVFVGEGDSGGTFFLSIGQQLVVTLASNPTTGYSWSYQSSSSGVLRDGPSEYVPTQPVLPGSGGTERFVFTGADAGRTRLRFEYRRAWETGVPPAQVVEYTVAVA